MATIEVTPVTSADELAEALRVRARVFVDEQQIAVEEEIDRYDAAPTGSDALHLLARVDGAPIGAARLLLDAPQGGPVHLGRVAVLAEWRRHGVGNALMARLHDEARARGYRRIEISAQVSALPFYERLGYIAEGPVYLEAGLDHRAMHFAL
ncbi:MAG: GNAT family N-acetyltransferase [Dehalococcoidia bacterium]|nr:MAG: GNAT family N-acetyltransferase [Dehalococcoidia bacterium]